MPLVSPSHTIRLPVTPTFCASPLAGAGEISRFTESIADRSEYDAFFHVTSNEPSPKSSCGAAGGSGFSSGRASAEAGEASDGPTAFSATTVNVYVTLLVSGFSVHVVVAQLNSSPWLDVTV